MELEKLGDQTCFSCLDRQLTGRTRHRCQHISNPFGLIKNPISFPKKPIFAYAVFFSTARPV